MINRYLKLQFRVQNNINLMNHGKGLLGESTRSELLQQSYNPSLRHMVQKTNSIQLDQMDVQYIVQKKQESKTNSQKQFSMNKVALVLQKKKGGIIQNNMMDKDMGREKWKLGKIIASGGSGRVYRALNSMTGCLCALKKVHLKEMNIEDCRNEISILTKMNHQNIVKYVQHYYLIDQSDQTWIFMEYVPSSLQKFYKEFGPPPLETFLYFAKQLLHALDYIHENKIIHKDLKCANVLLTNQGVLKLSDFGCSKNFDQTSAFMKYMADGSKTQKGTTSWMAPQSITDNKYTTESDVWSLGCTFLELATGNIPWSETGLDEYRLLVLIGGTEDIPKIAQDLPQIIQKLIKGCLIRDPQKRWKVKQMLKIIEQAQKW